MKAPTDIDEVEHNFTRSPGRVERTKLHWPVLYLWIFFPSLSFFKPLGTCIIMPDEVFRISPGLASLRLRTSKEGLDSSASV